MTWYRIAGIVFDLPNGWGVVSERPLTLSQIKNGVGVIQISCVAPSDEMKKNITQSNLKQIANRIVGAFNGRVIGQNGDKNNEYSVEVVDGDGYFIFLALQVQRQTIVQLTYTVKAELKHNSELHAAKEMLATISV